MTRYRPDRTHPRGRRAVAYPTQPDRRATPATAGSHQATGGSDRPNRSHSTRRLGRALLIIAFACSAGALVAGRPVAPRSGPAGPATGFGVGGPRRSISAPTSVAASSPAGGPAGPSEAWPSVPPTTTSGPVDRQDPALVAGEVASGLYQADGRRPGWRADQTMLSAHARRIFDDFVARPRRRSVAAPAVVQLLDPRETPVVVQVDVTRWWADAGVPTPDPSPHLVRLTMVLQPGDRWSVDDIQVIS